MNLSPQVFFQLARRMALAAWMGFLFACSMAHADDVDFVIGSEPAYRLRVSLLAEQANWSEHVQSVQSRYYDLLFDRLDADDDGKLTPTEARRTPAPVFSLDDTQTSSQSETHVAFNFLVLDDDGNGTVSREELKAYYKAYSLGPIGFGRWNVPGASNGRSTLLFQHLDQNQDGTLDAAEIEGRGKLWNFDRDADELLSQAELSPATASVSSTGEFVARSSQASARAVGNYEVKPERIDGEAPVPDLHLKYRPSSGVHSQFDLQTPANDTLEISGNRVAMTLRDLRVEFLVRAPSLRILEQTRDVLRREVASLPGEKRITDEETFPVFLRDHASLIDANADGKLAQAELESYLEELLPARLAAESVRVVFRNSSTIAGLFGYLDQDQDGQLSHQELARLAKSITDLDRNADQKLSAEEIPLIVRIVMERETAPPPYLIAEQRNAGPPWFYRLDKNQDETLSPAEFPGTGELFEQLDQNQNQILTLEEALAADAKAQRTSKAQEN